jgi:tartrate-resistant acid phosphatase type 5
MTRKRFLQLAVAALIALPVSFAHAANELRFMVMGDWGKPLSTTQPHLPTDGQKRVAEQMARYADAHKNTSPVQFVTLTGDNFYENGVTGVDDVQWQTKFEQVYDKARLPMPFIAVLGNHDWRWNPSAQISYAGTQAAQGKSTRWQMDGFYFKRTYGAPDAPLADFFYIDTDLWNYGLTKLADAQLKWLEAELKNSKASWQIVVAHHPLFTDGAHAKDAELVKLRETLLPLFKKYGVDVMFAGHDHNLQDVVNPAHPTKIIISGGGAEFRPRKTNDYGDAFFAVRGFAGVVLTPTQLRGEFIDDNGKTLHTVTVSPIAPTP